MKYFAYCRKSTDEDTRQVQSIQAQITELKEYAKKEGVVIEKIYKESKTAKVPGREIFNQMLIDLEQGKADGLIAWHPDRLARNSVDGGKVIYMMDQGLIKDLKFPTYWVDNTPQGKFTLSLAFGQSKYYIDNLSQNVKRGQREKLRKGVWPTVAPLGYLNDKAEKTIVPDPRTFPLIKRGFHEFAQGQHSLKQLAKVLYEWGVKSKSNKPLSKSVIQRLLTNPFYMGIMEYGGKRYKGTHKKMINTGTYLQVQKVIKQRGKPDYFKEKKKFFPFTGMMTCGECGCSITAETAKGHTYYRCTKKKGKCSQKYLRSENLEEQVDKILRKIEIDDEIFGLMKEAVKLGQKEDFDTHVSSLEYWQSEQKKIAKKRKSLMEKFVDGLIDEVDFEDMKNEIDIEMSNIEDNLESLESTNK
jgi:site-specific DNA recombinase